MEAGWIFDMDGVILDSNPHHKTAWSIYLEKEGLPFTDQIFDHVISGMPGNETIRRLHGEGISDREAERRLDEIDGTFRDLIRRLDHLEPLPGLREFLNHIRRQEQPVALATSAPPGNVEIILQKLRLRGCFDRVIDRTCVSRGKPDPEVYLKAVHELQVDPSRCMVFEDSLAGIEAALGAGLKVAGVSTSHTREELLNSGVQVVIPDFTGLTPEQFYPVLRENQKSVKQ